MGCCHCSEAELTDTFQITPNSPRANNLNKHIQILLLLFTCSFSVNSIALECFELDVALPDGVDSATGFRMERYRTPVPATITGGCLVNTADVQREAVAESNWLLLDVFPPKGLGHDPLDGEWIISEDHSYIEGSMWLPEVGRGFIEEEHSQYFRRNLEKLTNNDKTASVVFYCTADCWQSWNAARRAISWGYSNVLWYAEGIDGWLENGFELVPGEPTNFFAHLEK